MSYHVMLLDRSTHTVLHVDEPHGMGDEPHDSTKAHLTITTRHDQHFRDAFEHPVGLLVLMNVTGEDSIPILEAAVKRLHDPGWSPSEGAAKRALLQVLAMAKLRPDGVWSVVS